MSNVALARSIVLLHPAVMSVAWIVLSASSLNPIASLLLLTQLCAWSWAVYTVSMARRAHGDAPKWMPWLFAAPPILAVIAKVAHLSTDNSPMAFLIFGTVFFGLWRAAEALETADPQGKPVTTGRVAGTMLLLFFQLVGVWWLRHKIQRVTAISAI